MILQKTPHRQRVHADVAFAHLTHPFGIAANICLVDTSPLNGSTELWLGTASDTTIDDHPAIGQLFIKNELLEERRKVRPPIYPCMQKGSIVLRDLRLWWVE